MKTAKMITDAQVQAMEDEIAAEIDHAARQALSEEEPSADTLTQGVYHDA
jgi:TPP-dependent pyruvate/acetoin dehydrogenase alpha subunit